MNIRSKLKSSPEIHTSALNDILFILLLFFLLVATLANPNVIKVNNPKGDSENREKQNIVVSIDSIQNFYVGREQVSYDSLFATLQSQLKLDNDSSHVIVLNADKKATANSIVEVMQMAKSLNAKTVMSLNNE